MYIYFSIKTSQGVRVVLIIGHWFYYRDVLLVNHCHAMVMHDSYAATWLSIWEVHEDHSCLHIKNNTGKYMITVITSLL